MTWEELNEAQREEVKQRILAERNGKRGEGTSYHELVQAARLVSDEEARKWAAGTEFSPDDFSCSAGVAGTIHEVRVTWPVSRNYRIWAKSPEDAVREMRERIDAGQVCVWADGFTADDGDDCPSVEIVNKEDN